MALLSFLSESASGTSTSSVALQSSAQIFLIRKGDTLSRIAQCLVGSPVYPKRTGSLDRVLEYNSSLKNPSKITEGYKINLPIEVTAYKPEDRFACEKDFEDWIAKPHSLVVQTPASSPSDSLSHPPKQSQRTPATVEVPTPPPSTPENTLPIEHFRRHSLFSFSPQTSYARLDGKDKTTSGKALVFSDLNYGGTFQWTQLWSPNFRSFAMLQATRIKMREAEIGSSITNAKETYSGFGIGIETKLSKPFLLGMGLHANQEIFYRSIGANSIVLDKVTLYETLAHAKWSLIETSPLGLSLGLSGGAIFPAKTTYYKTRFGAKYSGIISLEQAVGAQLLGIGLRYSRAHYSSSIAKQVRTDLGLDFSWTFEVGNENKAQ